jgi:hypothetical protein
MGVTLDITGLKFDRLTVIKFVEIKKNFAYWLCKCDCGNEKIIRGVHLRGKQIRSCGCLQIEKATKHNKSRTKLYRVWKSMIARCYNNKNHAYADYGGRGIKVCDEWLNSFETFLKDMGEKPTIKHSIDRINNNANYCKENCKWSTKKEQSLNKRNSFKILDTKNNIIYFCIYEAAKTINMCRKKLSKKLKGLEYNDTDFILCQD